MLYRICTENKNYEDIVKLVSRYFDGFTVIKTEGYWKGQKEHSLIIEIVSDAKDTEQKIGKIIFDIKRMNKQESVLVEKIECTVNFV